LVCEIERLRDALNLFLAEAWDAIELARGDGFPQ